MLLALALFSSLLAQDEKVELAWRLKEKEELPVRWKMALKMKIAQGAREASTDLKMDISGKFLVQKIGEGGAAEGEFRLRRYELAGTAGGREMEALYEDGEVKKSKGAPDGGQRLKEAAEKPVKLVLQRNGEYQVKEAHPLLSFFGGRGDLFGAVLPDRRVGPGDTWEGVLQTAQSRQTGGPAFKVRYKLSAVEKAGEEKVARILLEDEQEFEARGVKSRYTLRTTSLFNVDRGRTVSSKLEVKGKGRPAGGEEGSLEFEAVIELALGEGAGK